MPPDHDTNGSELVDYDTDPVTRSLPAILTCLTAASLCFAGGLAARWMGWW